MDQHKHHKEQHSEEASKENQKTEQKFPPQDFNENGTVQFPSDEGFTEDKYSAEESGEFTSTENDAALEERIANDQNRQGGDVNLKSTNEPLGRSDKGEETENL